MTAALSKVSIFTGLKFAVSKSAFTLTGDGSQLTIDDVISMLNNIRAKESPAHDIFSGVKEIHRSDAQTITVELSKPYPPFTSLLAAPMSRVIKKIPNSRFPLGTGPFKFESLNTLENQKVLTLVRNELYRDHPPHIMKLELWQMSEADALKSVAKGFIHDTANFLSASGLAESNNRIKQVSAPSASTWIIAMNTNNGPTNDLRLRECLAHAFPRQALLNLYLRDHQEGFAFLPPLLLGSNTETLPAKKAPSGCAAFSTEALTLDYPIELKDGDKMCQAMSHSWKNSGLNINCQARTFNELALRIQNGEADLSFMSATLDLPDVEFLLSSFESSSQFNFSNYHSTTFDDDMMSARTEPDRLKRAFFYEKMNRELYEQSVTINISYPTHISYHHACLSGFKLDFSGEYYINYNKIALMKDCPYDKDFN